MKKPMRVRMQRSGHLVGLCIVVLVCSAVHAQQTTPAPKAASAPKAPPASKPKPSISNDAQAAAGRLWDSVVRKCGAKTYAWGAELDNPSFKIEAVQITRAEELNGVQWKGFAIVTASAFRRAGEAWSPPQEPTLQRDGWQKNEFEATGMVKISGEWRYMTLYGGDIRYETTDWDLDLTSLKDKLPSCPNSPSK